MVVDFLNRHPAAGSGRDAPERRSHCPPSPNGGAQKPNPVPRNLHLPLVEFCGFIVVEESSSISSMSSHFSKASSFVFICSNLSLAGLLLLQLPRFFLISPDRLGARPSPASSSRPPESFCLLGACRLSAWEPCIQGKAAGHPRSPARIDYFSALRQRCFVPSLPDLPFSSGATRSCASGGPDRTTPSATVSADTVMGEKGG